MIGKLKGKVDSRFGDHAIIDVNGVGYLVFCSAKTLQQLSIGGFCELFIDTHVREDHIHLYGFISEDEKRYFHLLNSVNGIGPRMAVSILSQLTPEQICLAVGRKNKEEFHSISGVGAKLAERIIIELKDKVGIFSDKGDLIGSHDSKIGSDAVSALVSLGVNKAEAQSLVAAILSTDPQTALDKLVKTALQQRGASVIQ